MKHLAISSGASQSEKILNFIFESDLPINRVTIIETSNSFTDEEKENLKFFGDHEIEIIKSNDINWKEIDIYIFNDVISNLPLLTAAVAQGVFSIDISGKTAILDKMPVVVPSVDEIDIEEAKVAKMVALPDKQVLQLLYTLKPLADKQKDLIVSVTSILPVSHDSNNLDEVEKLVNETRNVLNLTPCKDDKLLAFNIQSLSSLNTEYAINIEGQIKKLLPNINIINIHSVVAPVFYGITQQVSVNLNSTNHWDQDILNYTLNNIKNNNNIYYSDKYISPRSFLSSTINDNEEERYICISEFCSIDNYVSWKSVSDHNYLQAKLTVQLLEIFFN